MPYFEVDVSGLPYFYLQCSKIGSKLTLVALFSWWDKHPRRGPSVVMPFHKGVFIIIWTETQFLQTLRWKNYIPPKCERQLIKTYCLKRPENCSFKIRVRKNRKLKVESLKSWPSLQWCLHLDVMQGHVSSSNLERYADGGIATSVSQPGQIKRVRTGRREMPGKWELREKFLSCRKQIRR